MPKIDEVTQRSMRALKGSPEFNRVLAWLAKSLRENDVSLRYLEGESLYRAQGASITLEKILDAVESAQK